MDVDAFWQLIADSLEHAPGRAGREHYLEGRLAALAPDGIVAFQAFLDQACDRAFTGDCGALRCGSSAAGALTTALSTSGSG